MAVKDAVSSQGIACAWGTTVIEVTSLQYNRSASAEIDITGVDSAATTDPNWSTRRVVVKSTEYGVVDPGEVQLEFVANAAVMLLRDHVGYKRLLSLSNSPAPGGVGPVNVSVNAILSQFSIQSQVGEVVRGNCTFRLTEF
jgi:hypothetical protein